MKKLLAFITLSLLLFDDSIGVQARVPPVVRTIGKPPPTAKLPTNKGRPIPGTSKTGVSIPSPRPPTGYPRPGTEAPRIKIYLPDRRHPHTECERTGRCVHRPKTKLTENVRRGRLPEPALQLPQLRSERDPVVTAFVECMTINRVQIRNIWIVSKKNTLIALHNQSNIIALSCDRANTAMQGQLPLSVENGLRPAKDKISINRVRIIFNNPLEFLSAIDQFSAPSTGNLNSPPVPPLPPLPRPMARPPVPPLPPNGGSLDGQGYRGEGGNNPCKLEGEVCFDAKLDKASASISCGPIGISLSTKGEFAISLKASSS